MRSWRGIIYGEPASKANSRKIIVDRQGATRVAKSAKALRFVRDTLYQVPVLPRLLEGPLRITANIFYRTERPDLDESALLDVLQSRIYANDRQIREKHIYHAVDAAQPRVELLVEEIAQPVMADLFPKDGVRPWTLHRATERAETAKVPAFDSGLAPVGYEP